jgi:sugar phosphate isomerase/epimerase
VIPLSFSTLGCPNYTLDQVLDLATSAGYDGVELRFLNGQVDLAGLEEFKPDGIARTRERLDMAGVTVACVDTSIRFSSPDPDERSKQLEAAHTYAKIAAALGAPYIRLFGGTVTPDQAGRETTQRIADGLAEAATISKQYGVTAVLETHDSFCTSKQVAELFAANPAPDLAILWDVLHSYRTGEAFEDTYAALGDRIKHVHLKDSGDFSPTHFDLKLAGEGKLPFQQFFELLKRVEYKGFVSFEWEKAWHPEIEEPEVAIPQFALYVKGLR